MRNQNFIEPATDFFVDAEYRDALAKLGITSNDAVFSFEAGRNLSKNNLPRHRSRVQIEIDSPRTTLFLKRYNRPPIPGQIRNWLTHGSRRSTMHNDLAAADSLARAGISTPKTISYGVEWGMLFEKRSFIISEKIPDAESLERKLPDCFYGKTTAENLREQRVFISELAGFARKFHQTGFRHRDFYLAHIFYSRNSCFYLIDLQRAFRPRVFAARYRIKDIAQLHYSAPLRYFSRTDRMRFYLAYSRKDCLEDSDKKFIRSVIAKARRMAHHDAKHSRPVGLAKKEQ